MNVGRGLAGRTREIAMIVVPNHQVQKLLRRSCTFAAKTGQAVFTSEGDMEVSHRPSSLRLIVEMTTRNDHSVLP